MLQPNDPLCGIPVDPWLGESSSEQLALWQAAVEWAALCAPAEQSLDALHRIEHQDAP